MLVVGSNRFVLNNNLKEQETLDSMGIEDVEEGEISDSASIEEISEEDFNKQEVRVLREAKPKADNRVWTMRDLRDLYKYHQACSGYASRLYNLAWAQAVQNKPLNDIFVTDDEESKRSSSSSITSRDDSSSAKEVAKVIIDDSGDEMDEKMDDVSEKEEGELEEGEIDLDSEAVVKVEEGVLDVNEIDLKERELVELVKSIQEALESVTVIEAEKSFSGVCSRLQDTLGSLQKVVGESSVPTKDALAQQLINAIRALNYVFCSMNSSQKELNKDVFSRLLSCVESGDFLIFSLEHIKEIEVMMSSLDTPAAQSSAKASDRVNGVQVTNRMDQNILDGSVESAGRAFASAKKLSLDLSVESYNQDNPIMLSDALKPGLSSSRGRFVFGPLLDLHKDHDEDSLPSPTGKAPQCFPVHKSELVPAKVAHETQDSIMHPYETDALKAVSTYQQKFGLTSFLPIDKLPSPTPSEESGDAYGDISGEVSSSSTISAPRTANAPALGHPIVSSAPRMDSSIVQGLTGGRNAALVSSGPHLDGSVVQGLVGLRNTGPVSSRSNSILRASAKSRDPRLRLASSDAGSLDLNERPLPAVSNAPKVDPFGEIVSSRKQKSAEEPVLDGPVTKRQRNGLTSPATARDAQTVVASGGWLEESNTVIPQIMNRNQLIENTGTDPKKLESKVIATGIGCDKPYVTVNGNEHLAAVATSTTASLQSLLKGIAVNPAVLMNLINKVEQQKSGDPAKNTVLPPTSNSILGAVPPVSVSPLKPSALGQKPVGTLQGPQTGPMNPQDESGKVRMKPRDPRRILHTNSFQRSGSSGSEQFKTNAQKQEDQTETKSMPSHSVNPPDISQQFTKNLKNIADLMSASQASMSPTFSQVLSSQPVQVNTDRMDVKTTVSDSGDQQTANGSKPESAAGAPQSQNTWGDVEHLFDGFDDQQKAAIQRERARRIEEQKKMFAAHKLCLVLDLDHTLLNSAKFVEVDPKHDEILRKKEEQDREKSQRHLFRFPHMGMWTKLRPGIWNFLEKASKLYELHLYTMGNKLYATEMAKVLDPKGVLFAGRVISKGDDGDVLDGDERVPKSKDLEGVLGMESAVVIIDDSVRVWPHNKLNLIAVERYTYFPCSRRQFGLPGPSLLEIDHDERPEDGTLASSLAVIERIHQSFFSNRSLDEVDVRNILASEQRKILAGCRIVFSRVFPVGEANPHLHPLWQTAESFGAVCTNQIDEQVTHVVANSLGTDKVNWALSTGRFVVHPGWVEASALLYRRANEQDFAINP